MGRGGKCTVSPRIILFATELLSKGHPRRDVTKNRWFYKPSNKETLSIVIISFCLPWFSNPEWIHVCFTDFSLNLVIHFEVISATDLACLSSYDNFATQWKLTLNVWDTNACIFLKFLCHWSHLCDSHVFPSSTELIALVLTTLSPWRLNDTVFIDTLALLGENITEYI